MKLNPKLFLIVLSGVFVATLSAFPLQAAVSHRTSRGSLLEAAPTLHAIFWSQIFERLRRQEVPGGSRGIRNQPELKVCAVVPGRLINQETDSMSPLKVWDLNPVFIWQGAWNQLEVFREDDQERLLSQELTPETQHLFYSDVEDAIPLEPGVWYYWKLSRDGSNEQKATFGETSFRTLDEADRSDLEADLATEVATVSEPERVLITRVNFLAEQGLWADVFRELYSTDELPAELATVMKDLADHDFCAQSTEIGLLP